MTSQGDVLRDRDGNPILDRYGRPIRLRRPGQSDSPVSSHRREQPRAQQVPPRNRDPRGQSAQGTRRASRQYIPPRQDQRQAYYGAASQQPPRSPQQTYGQPPRQPQQRPAPAGYQRPPRRAEQARYIPPAQPRSRARTLSWKKIIAGILAFLLLAVAALTVWTDARLNRVAALPDTQVANTAGTNWLLVGSDSRLGMTEEEAQRLGTGGDIGSARADTMMLLHIPLFGQATLVSLPRDSYVAVPGYGMDKLNAAFTYGGPQLLTQTVEGATGLRVDHYAEIGMGGLAGVVDAVGGVEICPPEPIEDPLAALSISAGCQMVDGPTALGYVRTRATPMGDLDRVARQREFFAALLAQITSASTFLNPFRALSLISSVSAAFTVDKGDHVWNLARVALAMRSGVATETVPVGGFADYDVGNVVLWDEAAATELFSSLR